MTTHSLICNITEKSKPKGEIIVKLPAKAQREIDSWKKKAVKRDDGSKIILLELKAYQDDIIIQDADNHISFD